MLADEVRNAERAKWLAENKPAIAAANKLVETEGLFSDAYRKIGQARLPSEEPLI